MDNNVLSHHGTKGMRWGIRRYQNKDGTLTPAGKKRYNKELERVKTEQRILRNKQRTQAKIDKLEAMKKDLEEKKKQSSPDPDTKVKKQSSDSSGKRTVREMSDKELKTIVDRLNLEQRYKELTPQKVSRGKEFVSGMYEKAFVPAVQEVGKQVMKKVLSNYANNFLEKVANKVEKAVDKA